MVRRGLPVCDYGIRKFKKVKSYNLKLKSEAGEWVVPIEAGSQIQAAVAAI